MVSQQLLSMAASLALSSTYEDKVRCGAQTRNQRTGYVANTCTIHQGHVDQDNKPNDHVDTHSGARWSQAV